MSTLEHTCIVLPNTKTNKSNHKHNISVEVNNIKPKVNVRAMDTTKGSTGKELVKEEIREKKKSKIKRE